MNVSTPIKTRCSLILAFLSAIACAPEGNFQRTIHPVSKRFTERQAPSPASAAPDNAPPALTAETVQSKGLPAACSTDSNKQLCIHCMSEHWAVERCYEFEGKFAAENDCFYTNDHVKCLTKSPPFALYLDWRTSHEKFLRENFLVWQNTVHQIWDNKLQADDKEESDRLLKSLDWLTLTLSTKADIEAADGDTWVKLLELKPAASKEGQDLLLSLQQSRLDGKLTLAFLLEKVGDSYIRTHGASNLWEDLSTISLEGLED
ncbi:MAG: hypothetical protein H7318_15315 [Oligoflexus sp.]|nr:hypothetical protein [Oligoflexus sp.]